MRKVVGMLAATMLLTVTLTGCVGIGAPINGSLFVNHLKAPAMMGDNTAGHSKTGTAEAMGVFGFVSGDCSIKAAMDSVGITKVHHVDSEVFHVLGIYATYKTVVYGD